MKLAIVLTLGWVLAGCARQGDSAPQVVINKRLQTAPNPEVPPSQGRETANVDLSMPSDAEVFTYLKAACVSCHGHDVGGSPGPHASFWTLDTNALSLESLEISTDTPRVYATIVRAAQGKDNPQIRAMPPSRDAAAKETSAKIARWFEAKLPIAVMEASSRYSEMGSLSEGAKVSFRCDRPLSAREFFTKFSLSAFDLPPDPDLMTTLKEETGIESLDSPVTLTFREKTVALLDKVDHANRFANAGLVRLAEAISGSPRIASSAEVPASLRPALRQEFSILLARKWDSWTYDKFFTSDIVMANAVTAPLYGCQPPAETEEFTECRMQFPRRGFFTTLGFLASRPSSFLVENNNYGRVAGLYFSLFGEGLKAATNGPAGDGSIPPLPGCLEKDDMRAFGLAPRGVAAIPASGTLCQSCHIGRHLAAGAALFRPFSTVGTLFTIENLGAPGSVDRSLVTEATGNQWTLSSTDTTQVTVAHLQALLQRSMSQPGACATSSSDPAKMVQFQTVNDLAADLISNGSALASGFSRHATRAFSSRESVGLDALVAAREEWKKGRRTVRDLTKSYFLSESFSCRAN